MQSSSRNGYGVRVLAVHTTEGIMRAVDLRDWTSWAGSSHASADETGALLSGAEDGFVDYARASWTLRSGNPWSENIELCGFAGWTPAEWAARPKLLDACAKWLAARSKARGIPLVKLTPQQYRAGASGVIGHHDHTIGYADGTHWDPGPNFPWDSVLAKARDYAGGIHIAPEDDMFSDTDRWKLDNVENSAARMELALFKMNRTIAEQTGADVDEVALAKELAPLLVSASRSLSDADLQAVATAVADEQARRQSA